MIIWDLLWAQIGKFLEQLMKTSLRIGIISMGTNMPTEKKLEDGICFLNGKVIVCVM